jgi:hypothetical protein
MAARASVLRSVLDDIWATAQSTGVCLHDALWAANRAHTSQTSGSTEIASTTGNGESVTFRNSVALSRVSWIDATDTLKRLYELCLESLNTDPENPPIDCEVYGCMSSRIVQKKRIATTYHCITR